MMRSVVSATLCQCRQNGAKSVGPSAQPQPQASCREVEGEESFSHLGSWLCCFFVINIDG
jgi:hypothetical protein